MNGRERDTSGDQIQTKKKKGSLTSTRVAQGGLGDTARQKMDSDKKAVARLITPQKEKGGDSNPRSTYITVKETSLRGVEEPKGWSNLDNNQRWTGMAGRNGKGGVARTPKKKEQANQQ